MRANFSLFFLQFFFKPTGFLEGEKKSQSVLRTSLLLLMVSYLKYKKALPAIVLLVATQSGLK